MTRSQIAQTLEAFRRAKDDHDVPAVVALRTEDCVDVMAATGVRLAGKEAIDAYFRAFFAAVPDYRGQFDGVAYGENAAAVWGRFAGTVHEQLLGVRVDGPRKLRVPCAFALTFREGKVVEDRQYWDAATVAEQLGVAVDAIRRRRVAA
jgi:ketosteroid isomerase-like protein